MKTAKEIEENLIQFTGTEHYYKHPFGIVFTDGIKYLADECQCYWLLDIVASYHFEPKVKKEDFQVYKLKVNEDKSAILTIEEGNYIEVVRQDIEFTDMILNEVEIWFANGVCYLPSEH